MGAITGWQEGQGGAQASSLSQPQVTANHIPVLWPNGGRLTVTDQRLYIVSDNLSSWSERDT
jgi:hypothetical protein